MWFYMYTETIVNAIIRHIKYAVFHIIHLELLLGLTQ